NNILAPILMSAPLLRWGLKAEELEKVISRIESSTQRGAQVVKQLLTLGRGVEGQRGVLQLRHLLREMAGIVEETFPKNIALKQEIAPDLWTIVADASQLHQVLLNLCVNARDAMPQGGKLTFKAENLRFTAGSARNTEAKPGPYVLIEVQDTGTGIPAHMVEKIFEPFFTTKEPGKGTGLGLATVASIVRGHGGFIEVESEVGRGTNFRIYLHASPEAVVTQPID